MKDILAKHPDLKDVLNRLPQLQQYSNRTEHGKLIDAWEKDKNGHWVDVTERERLKEQIAAEQEEIERLHRLELKKQAKEQEHEQAITK